jgi:hypothetical protein
MKTERNKAENYNLSINFQKRIGEIQEFYGRCEIGKEIIICQSCDPHNIIIVIIILNTSC